MRWIDESFTFDIPKIKEKKQKIIIFDNSFTQNPDYSDYLYLDLVDMHEIWF